MITSITIKFEDGHEETLDHVMPKAEVTETAPVAEAPAEAPAEESAEAPAPVEETEPAPVEAPAEQPAA